MCNLCDLVVFNCVDHYTKDNFYVTLDWCWLICQENVFFRWRFIFLIIVFTISTYIIPQNIILLTFKFYTDFDGNLIQIFSLHCNLIKSKRGLIMYHCIH